MKHRPDVGTRVFTIVGWMILMAYSAFAQGPVLLREAISREYSIGVGEVQTPAAQSISSREWSLFVEDGLAQASVVSREVSLVVTTAATPDPVGHFLVTATPTGDGAKLDWSSYNELAQVDLAQYRIYLSDGPFDTVSGLTPYLTVGAGTFTLSVSNLTAYHDHFFAVVPVDALGKFNSNVKYSSAYVLAPQTLSREYTLFVGAEPPTPYAQVVSREVSLLVPSATPPDPVAQLKVTASPTGDAAVLDWTSYNELLQRDIVRYDIYLASGAFSSVSGLTPLTSVGGGTLSVTVSNLTAYHDHFFAVVPVDGQGRFDSQVKYASAYVLAPQTFSREFSLFVGAEPASPYGSVVSRELSVVVPSSTIPAPVTGLSSGFSAQTSTSAFSSIDLDWTHYNEVAQLDVARYRVYIGTTFFTDVSAMTPYEFAPGGMPKHTTGGLVGGDIYYVAVVAEDVLGRWNPTVRSVSVQASVGKLGEVRSLAVSSSSNSLNFSWASPESIDTFLDHYNLYFDGATLPVPLPASATSYLLSGLPPSSGHTLRITTVDTFHTESLGSTLLAATWLDNPQPIVPDSFDGIVRLTWSPVDPNSLVKHYAIYKLSSGATTVSGLTPLKVTTGTRADISGLVNGTTYYFAVTTVNVSDGENPAVQPVAATPNPVSGQFADLKVNNVAAPTATYRGQSILISWSTLNVGLGSTSQKNGNPVTSWNDRIVLSKDAVFGNSDDLILADVPHAGGLNPADSYSVNQSVSLPANVSGAYHLFVLVNADRAVYEYLDAAPDLSPALPLNILSNTPPTFSWPPIDSIAFGTPLGATQLDASSTASGTFAYTPSAGAVLPAGTNPIVALFTPDDSLHYLPAQLTNYVVVIKKLVPQLTWPALASISYGTPLGAAQLDASSSVAGSFAYTPGLGTVLGGGSNLLVAVFSPADSAKYSTASISNLLQVSPASQSINFPALGSLQYSIGTNLTLNAAASSGLSIVYQVLSGPASVSGNTLTLTGAGTVVVNATQPGNANYVAATPVQRSLTVQQGTQTIAFTPPSSVSYTDGLKITLTATASSGLPVSLALNSGPGVLSGNVVSVSGPGTINLTASQPGDSNFLPASSVPASIVIQKGVQTIDFSTNPVVAYSLGLTVPLTARASSRLPVDLTIVDGPGEIHGTNLLVLGHGTVHVQAAQSGNTLFAPATPVVNAFEFTGAPQTISFPPLSSVVFSNGLQISLSASSSSGLPVSFTVTSGPGTVQGKMLTVLGAGMVVVTAHQAGNDVFEPAAAVSQSLSAGQATPTLSWKVPSDISYGTPLGPTQLSATASVPGTFSYLPMAGTVLNVGPNQTLSVAFTPSDMVNFKPVSGSVSVNVLPYTAPKFGVQFASSSIYKSAGPNATVGTVTLDTPTPRDLQVTLTNSDPIAISIPPSVVVPAGQTTAAFAVGAIENYLVDGSRNVTVTPQIVINGAVYATGTPGTLFFNDDTVPTLSLVIANLAVPEGLDPATTATVYRNTPTNSDLTVTLSSDTPTKALVPPTVTIPAGSLSQSFPIQTVNNHVRNGDVPVTLTAMATGLTNATASFLVTDVNLPDLVAVGISGPISASTGDQVNLFYRVENRGVTPAVGPFQIRVGLSTRSDGAGDVLASQYVFPGSLNPGDYFELSPAVILPVIVGDLYPVLTVDPADFVPELNKTNNVLVASTPIHVNAAYTASVKAGLSSAPNPTAVPLSGRAIKGGSGAGAPYVLVNLHLHFNGFHRVISALTDANGYFSVNYQPLPGEVGHYTVGAGNPGLADVPAQDSFTIFGFRADPSSVSIMTTEHASVSGKLNLVNLLDVPLTGLTAQVVDDAAGLSPGLTLSSTTLTTNGQSSLSYSFSAGAALPQSTSFTIKITSTEGAVVNVPFSVVVRPLRPQLEAIPSTLVAGMVRGQQRSLTLVITNSGAGPTGPIDVVLPPVPWLTLASTNRLSSMAPGDTNRLTLLTQPASDLPLGSYDGTMVLNASNAVLAIPFHLLAVNDAIGDLKLDVVDEYTYYAAGAPKVTNATVVIRDTVTRNMVTNGITDGAGNFFVSGLPEAYYDVEVSADKHSSYRSTIYLVAGSENPTEVFLARETVQFLWTVEPTTVQDRTRVTIETVFETVVPVPVLTISPSVIDLADITNDITTIDLTISNHGLLAAQETHLTFADHPSWKLTPLISNLGTLPANSSITIPLKIQRLSPAASSVGGEGVGVRQISLAASNGGPCSFWGSVAWQLLCGPRVNHYSSGVAVVNAATCGGPVPIFSGGPGGGGGGGGPFYSVSLPIVTTPTVCDCRFFPKICIGIDGEIKLDGIAKMLADKLKALTPQLSVYKSDVKLSASGKLCTCCVSNQIDYTANGTAQADLKIVLRGGIAPSFDFKTDAGEWSNVSISGNFLLGVEATIAGNIKISANKECLKPSKTCITGTASLTLFAGTKGGVKVAANRKSDGVGFSGDGDFTLGIQGSGSVTANWCDGEPGTLTACGRVDAKANVNANLEAKIGPVSVMQGFSANADTNIGKIGNCGDGSSVSPNERLLGLQDSSPAEEVIAPDAFLVPRQDILTALGANNTRQGICAHVALQLDQDAVLSRDAFKATLQVLNQDSVPLDSFVAEVHAKDANGNPADNFFLIRPAVLSGIPAIDGTGNVPPNSSGTVTWTLIPTIDSAPMAPAQYFVGGVLHYVQGGVPIDYPLADVSITVHPSPQLTVQYFHQRDVFADDPFTSQIEPSIPFALAVLVKNHGYGIAHNFEIISSQPKIVDNEKGLLIDFKIIASQVAGQNLTPSLTANFGDVGPGTNVVADWLMTSTLQGLFVDYKATFQNIDGLGAKRLAIIDDVTIHEMIRQVEANGAFADGLPDFLVHEDTNDLHHLPNKLYLSDGTTNDVTAVLADTIDGPPSMFKRKVQLYSTMPAGWGYLQVPEPSDGTMQLDRIVRDDGVELDVDKLFWTTDRTFIGMGQRPIYENLLHLLDFNSSGNYTLYYSPFATYSNTTPTSAVTPLAATSPLTFPVQWTGSEPGGSGIGYFDIYVSDNGGPFQLFLGQTHLGGSLYTGTPGHTYGFYSRATDMSGNLEANKTTAEASTMAVAQNQGPMLSVIADQVTFQDSPITNLPLTVVDSGRPVDNVTFTVGSSNPGLLPPTGVSVRGSGENRVVTITPAPGANGRGTLTIIANDGMGTGSTTFAVDVQTSPHAPMAVGDMVTRNPGQSVKFLASRLLSNDISPDSLTLTVQSVSPLSANGGIVRLTGNFIFYQPPAGNDSSDSFTYVVADTRGLTATATVRVVVLASGGSGSPTLNLLTPEILANGSVRVRFVGIPGRTYQIEATPDLLSGVWTALATRTADPAGLFDYEDSSGNTPRFYRAVAP